LIKQDESFSQKNRFFARQVPLIGLKEKPRKDTIFQTGFFDVFSLRT